MIIFQWQGFHIDINMCNIFLVKFIATSHDLTRNGGLVREIPLFQGNLGWWNIIILARFLYEIHCSLVEEFLLTSKHPANPGKFSS